MIEQTDAVQTVRHDLEAFYWVLVLVVARHTNHDHHRGVGLVRHLFETQDHATSFRRRRRWLRSPWDLSVRGNGPLTHLLWEYRHLCRRNLAWSGPGVGRVVQHVPITHDVVLRLFDEALGMAGWPTDDAALSYRLSHEEVTDEDEQTVMARVDTLRTRKRRREEVMNETNEFMKKVIEREVRVRARPRRKLTGPRVA